MTYLLSISIGPVQDFIAAARKTRDLWFGSMMLSEISREVANKLKDSGSAELIFPPEDCVCAPEAAVANKILAQVNTDDPAKLVDDLRKAAVKKLDEYKEEVKGALNSVSVGIDWELVDKQLDGFLEFYAAWWPMENDYSVARREVERLLAGRKALRDFTPACGRDGVPKSSLDGGRESVIDFDKLSEGEVRFLRAKGIRVGDRNNSRRSGEYLDGISLIKRVAGDRRFISLARVAADPLIRHLANDNELREQLSKLCNAAEKLKNTELVSRFDDEDFPQYKDFPYDTELFFYADANHPDIENASLDDDKKQAVDAFIETIADLKKQTGIGEIPPYAAVIACDGDRMGALISSLNTPEAHKEFSGKLAEFARAAGDIVKHYRGALVYSGGDDVLAFLPLDTVLSCAKELHDKFDELIGKEFTQGNIKPSLSCGISIAHFAENLRSQVQWARNAELAAKNNSRNSLAVHLHTRTAGDEFVGSVRKWSLDSGDSANDPVETYWNRWLGLYLQAELPSSAVYGLAQLRQEMKSLPEGLRQKVLEPEIKRIISRKEKQGVQKIDENIITAVTDAAKGKLDELDKLVNELIITRHICKAINLAGRGAERNA